MNKISHESWLNAVKTIAIMGVVVQHTRGMLYTNDFIWRSSWYCVAMFMLVAGYGIMRSYLQKGYFTVKVRAYKLISAYVIATAVYVVVDNRFFSADKFISCLLHFDASGPLYFVSAYLQLLLFSPLLLCAVDVAGRDKYVLVKQGILAAAVVGIAYITTHRSDLFGIIIGGGHLFGGVWLIFWHWGMLLAKYDLWHSKVKVWQCLSLLLCSGLLLLWEYAIVYCGGGKSFPQYITWQGYSDDLDRRLTDVAFVFHYKRVFFVIS